MRASEIALTRSPTVWAILLLVGCGDGNGGGGDSDNNVNGGPTTSLSFRDVALERGLLRHLTSGGTRKLSIVENIGTGCALLDANDDGHLDVFLPNAGTIVDGFS